MTTVEALDAWLDGLDLAGAAAVRAATARRLAQALEIAPPYAAARIALALEELVRAIESAPADPRALADEVARGLGWLKEQQR